MGRKKTCHLIFVHNSEKCLPISVTVGLCSEFATRLMSYFPPHLKCVTTQPCKIQKINNIDSLDVFNSTYSIT